MKWHVNHVTTRQIPFASHLGNLNQQLQPQLAAEHDNVIPTKNLVSLLICLILSKYEVASLQENNTWLERHYPCIIVWYRSVII